jgi:hypothetical protein
MRTNLTVWLTPAERALLEAARARRSSEFGEPSLGDVVRGYLTRGARQDLGVDIVAAPSSKPPPRAA